MSHADTTSILFLIPSFSILSIWSNHRRTLSSILSSTLFVTPLNYFIHGFRILFILLIPSKLLKLFICTALILDLSFHSIVSLPYIRAGISNVSWKTLTYSNCKSLSLIRDLMAPAAFLLHSAPSKMHHISIRRHDIT